MAISIGANAIIGLRIVPLSVPVSNDSVITVSMYGTAVKTVKVNAQFREMKPGIHQSLLSLGKQEVFSLGRKTERIKRSGNNWVRSEI